MIIFSLQSHTFLMNRLHWRCLLAKPSATATLDCTCLGHLGQCDTDWIASSRPRWPRKVRHIAVAGRCCQHFVLTFANGNTAWRGQLFHQNCLVWCYSLYTTLKLVYTCVFALFLLDLAYIVLRTENAVRNIILYLSWPLKTHLTL